MDEKEVNINVDKVRNDDSIKTVSMHSVGEQPNEIKTIGTLTKSKKGFVIKSILGVILTIIIIIAVVMTINLVVNYKMVQGNVQGKTAEIAGFSIVDKNYDPYHELRNGAVIYYSDLTVDKNKFIEFASDFKMGAVANVYNDKVGINVGSGKNLSLKKDQVRYVLEE